MVGMGLVGGMFEAETIVRLRDNPAQTGRTTGVTRDVSGRPYVEVEMADGSGKSMYPAGQLVHNEVARSIFDDLREGRFAEPRQLKNLLLHHRLTGRLRDVLYSMDVTDTDFHAYQFKPVVKLIGSPSQSLLIADEVGLGKTIEAGLAWTELVARFDCHRLLVLCPKSLTKKWQAELRQKFSVHAKIVDAGELLDVLRRQREQDEEFALIASTSSVRPHSGWDEDDAPDDVRTQLARFLDEQEADDPLVDCLIFDEAHHMRNRSTMNHELGELATAVSDYKLFLSATPINLNGQDLRSLLELLDPETFDSEDTFKVLIEENKPLVAARDLVLDPRSSFDVIVETLRTIPRGQLLKVDNQLDQMQRELQRPDLADSPDFRTRVAAHLEAMSLLGSIVNRTRRRDVNEIKVQRRPGCMRWKMTDQEASFYERATAVVREHASKANMNERFLLATPQRLIASSLPAAYRHWMGKAANYSVDDEDHEDEAAGGPLVDQLARLCSDPQELQALEDGDVKFAHLLSSIKKQRKSDPNGKLIVFSSFRTTLDYLHGRLKECGIKVEIMHGAVREARTDILDRFEATKDPCILLTSEVGGEGLDMQFCRVLVNYDLPWNPMKVEQRIGRIDRIGQQSPTIEIMSLICTGTIEEQVYDRLYQRIMQIEETLGAFEAVLGTELKGIESTMLDPAMTPEEQAAEIERRAIAMQETVRTTKELEEEAAGLIAHGDMILERINASRTAERRVTGPELADYVHQAISNRHPGSRIDDVPGRPGLYQVTLSAQAQVALKEVMTRSGRGRTKLMKEPRVEAVFERIEGMPRNAELITAVHPLVRLAARIRSEISEGVSMEPVASVMVSHVDVDLAPGTYVTMIERWGVEGAVRIDRMGFAAHAPDGSLLPSEDAERLVHLAMRLGRHDAPQIPGNDLEAVARLLHDGELDEACNAFVSEETARHDDRIATGMARIDRQRRRAADRMEAQRQRAMDASDSRRAGRMRILGAAEAKHRRLVARLDLKREELIHAQKKFNWSRNTVGMCVVRVV